MEDLQRRQPRRPYRSARLLPLHVERPRACRRDNLTPGSVPTRAASGRRAVAVAVVCLAGRRLVVESSAGRVPGSPVRPASAISWGSCPGGPGGFFEVFVTAEENWLPPDNYQEQPIRAIASRTSPTNIGVALLANLAAYDFGYSSASRLLERTQKTFATLGRLERYRGHFYNWYDTRTLKPLLPQYVSLVDSGNLVGDLLVLRSGLLELANARVLPPRVFSGLRDTVRVLLDVARGSHRTAEGGRTPLVAADILHKIESLVEDLGNRQPTLSAAATYLQRLLVTAAEIKSAVGPDEELQWWAGAFERSCTDHRDDLLQVAAWAVLPPPPEQVWRQESPELLRRLNELQALLAPLEAVPSLRAVAALQQSVLPLIDDILKDLRVPKTKTMAMIALGGASASAPELSANDSEPDAQGRVVLDWFGQLRRAIANSSRRATDLIKVVERVARQCHELADTDFTFLFDKGQDLFAIGYNAGEHRLDGSFYDLLASEARLASFVAIAQGQLGQEHWFALSRMLTSTGGAPTLLSWSGSMFEYLMPLLVMPTYENTLLDQTYRAVVRRQIKYGRQRGVPWGISESGYNTIDAHMNYQYRAFGVPGLGLKRGLAEDLVIAPYASVLALMVAPEAACRNLERLAAEGQEGAYGMYEAIDYTPTRLPRGTTSASIRQFMAHHEGMSLLALAYLLLDRPMQRRFDADPMLRAADLLLQERVPRAIAPIFPHVAEAGTTAHHFQRRGRDDAGLRRPGRSGAGSPSALQRPVSCRDYQRRRRLQPLARPGRHALARRPHPRLLGQLLLPARPGQRRALVHCLATDA